MANYGGEAGGHTGPYWRRQYGTTLPGERTGAELSAINALRKKAGQAPLGGPIGDNTKSAISGPSRPKVKTSPVLSNLAAKVAASTHANKGDLRAALRRVPARRAIFNG